MPMELALACVLRSPVVTAPLVGASKPKHLADPASALDLRLTADEVTALEEHYTPGLPQSF